MAGKIDSTDIEIMTILEKNSRIANTGIAKSLGVSEATVRNRIRNLEQNGVIRNVSIVKPEVLGYTIHVMVGVKVEMQKMRHVAEELKKNESVYTVNLTTGRYDIIFVAFFRSLEEQFRFLVDEVASIDGVIGTETSNVLKMVKANYVWGLMLPDKEKKK